MGVIRGSRESRAAVPWGDAPELAGLGDHVPLRARESRSTGAAERGKGGAGSALQSVHRSVIWSWDQVSKSLERLIGVKE